MGMQIVEDPVGIRARMGYWTHTTDSTETWGWRIELYGKTAYATTVMARMMCDSLRTAKYVGANIVCNGFDCLTGAVTTSSKITVGSSCTMKSP
jgi:hypothetical protein